MDLTCLDCLSIGKETVLTARWTGMLLARGSSSPIEKGDGRGMQARPHQ